MLQYKLFPPSVFQHSSPVTHNNSFRQTHQCHLALDHRTTSSAHDVKLSVGTATNQVHTLSNLKHKPTTLQHNLPLVDHFCSHHKIPPCCLTNAHHAPNTDPQIFTVIITSNITHIREEF